MKTLAAVIIGTFTISIAMLVWMAVAATNDAQHRPTKPACSTCGSNCECPDCKCKIDKCTDECKALTAKRFKQNEQERVDR